MNNTFLVLGIDAATFNVIKPNLDKLENFKKLLSICESEELILNEKPISASIWCGMFTGKMFEEHKHDKYVNNEHIINREDINLDFIWDILKENSKKVIAINVPFVIPPYSFQSDYKPVGFGLPSNEREWNDELEKITEITKSSLSQNPDLLITVYTLLDRIQHFHWGEGIVVKWYKLLDEKIGELLFETGFIENKNNRLIIISDHGFCSFGEALVRTLPEKTGLKGDHSEKSIVMTLNLDYKISKPQDVFFAIKDNFNL